MAKLKVQLNHPGAQKPFKVGNCFKETLNNSKNRCCESEQHFRKNLKCIGNGFIETCSGTKIRCWNSEQHYRKFLNCKGTYISDIKDKEPKRDVGLYFWGEWEGNSIFQPFINKYDKRVYPNGVHIPFHSILIRGLQNTDPYVYGKEFKYSCCKQKGEMCKLDLGSLILFGSVFPSLNKFYIDTVFVVGTKFEDAESVQGNKGENYSGTKYKEVTLEQLDVYLLDPLNKKSKTRIYHAQNWSENNEYFSFVPVKSECVENKGFERLYIKLTDTVFNVNDKPRSPATYLQNCTINEPEELWKEIVKLAKDQGFKLGIQFEEPGEPNAELQQELEKINILCNETNQQVPIPVCGKKNTPIKKLTARKGCS